MSFIWFTKLIYFLMYAMGKKNIVLNIRFTSYFIPARHAELVLLLYESDS